MNDSTKHDLDPPPQPHVHCSQHSSTCLLSSMHFFSILLCPQYYSWMQTQHKFYFIFMQVLPLQMGGSEQRVSTDPLMITMCLLFYIVTLGLFKMQSMECVTYCIILYNGFQSHNASSWFYMPRLLWRYNHFTAFKNDTNSSPHTKNLKEQHY
jgi:hypothetical protein